MHTLIHQMSIITKCYGHSIEIFSAIHFKVYIFMPIFVFVPVIFGVNNVASEPWRALVFVLLDYS